MLREIGHTKGIPGQGPRRWFNDEYLDLFVWYDAGGRILGFQLCFDKNTHAERALTYTEAAGYTFDQVATEASVCDLGSAVLVRAAEFSGLRLIEQLGALGQALEPALYEYLREKLEACPAPSSAETPEVTSRP
jgi:hypothetical protein